MSGTGHRMLIKISSASLHARRGAGWLASAPLARTVCTSSRMCGYLRLYAGEPTCPAQEASSRYGPVVSSEDELVKIDRESICTDSSSSCKSCKGSYHFENIKNGESFPNVRISGGSTERHVTREASEELSCDIGRVELLGCVSARQV